MPRSQPFQCHSCGTLYPKCHPKRGKGAGGKRASRSRARATAAQVLSREALPVDVVSDGDGGGVKVTAVAGRPADRAGTTEPKLQVPEPDGGAAGSSGPPLGNG